MYVEELEILRRGEKSALGNGNVLDFLIAHMAEKGMLVPPEGGLGAEGCWMVVEK